MRALPETFRADAEAAASAVVLDPATWDGAVAHRPVHLDALQRAVVDGVQVRLGYVGRDRRESDRMVHPLGLVSKGTAWYLVAGTDAGRRTFRLNRVRSVEVTDQPANRPPGFDLAEEWKTIVESLDEQRAPVRVDARASQDAIWLLRSMFGKRLTVGEPDAAGWHDVEMRGHHVEAIAGEIAGLGDRIEVLEPPEVRQRLAALGAELAATYGAPSALSRR